jgi:hypothetical protein
MAFSGPGLPSKGIPKSRAREWSAAHKVLLNVAQASNTNQQGRVSTFGFKVMK